MALTVLTPALLNELECRWRALELPIAERLRAGLSDDELDAETESLGLRLPEEARIWWRWHDGADLTGTAREWSFGPSGQPISPLRDAVGWYRELRSLAHQLPPRDAGGFEPEDWYAETWFPITVGGRPLLCECSPEGGSTTAIRVYDPSSENFREPCAASFGQVVTWWIRAYDDGIWRYDHGTWTLDVERRAALSAQPGQEGSRFFL